jgi:hypothetical protein
VRQLAEITERSGDDVSAHTWRAIAEAADRILGYLQEYRPERRSANRKTPPPGRAAGQDQDGIKHMDAGRMQ